MKGKYHILVLTDHTNHSSENSLYELVQAMRIHPYCAQIDIATRANNLNKLFFEQHIAKGIYVSKADEGFAFSPDGKSFKKKLRRNFLSAYDAVWLRMPPPLSNDFLNFLIHEFPSQFIFNDPKGIQITGSKKFLTHFAEYCPPMKICESIEDIVTFKNRFPIVLKPFREYGGKGIVRIDGSQVWEGAEKSTFKQFVEKNQNKKIEYLGVKFLKKVSEGDKRIVVVNGKVMGASLRLPAKGSWLCNIAMGGSSNFAQVDDDELKIVNQINPVLAKMGIVMYGLDTLVGDDGKRVLSEINTTSIGGLPQIAKLTNTPLVKQAVNLIWEYIIEKL